MRTSRASATVPLTLIGPGKVGKALSRALAGRKWPIRCIGGRRAGPARALARTLGASVATTSNLRRAAEQAPLVLLAVPESALREVATFIAGGGRFDGRGRTFLHTSGGAADDVLEPLRIAGAATGRFHPLYPFTGRRNEAGSLLGIHFGVEGDRRAVALASLLARCLGGKLVRLPAGSAASYHLSAVFASNLSVAVAAAAADLGREWGKPRSEALEALLPLLRGSLEQLTTQGLPAALTGPLARGEADTVTKHLDLLKKCRRPEWAELYRLLSRVGVDLAQEAGNLDPETTRRLKRALSSSARRRKKH